MHPLLILGIVLGFIFSSITILFSLSKYINYILTSILRLMKLYTTFLHSLVPIPIGPPTNVYFPSSVQSANRCLSCDFILIGAEHAQRRQPVGLYFYPGDSTWVTASRSICMFTQFILHFQNDRMELPLKVTLMFPGCCWSVRQ